MDPSGFGGNPQALPAPPGPPAAPQFGPVIGPQFCVPYNVDLVVTEKPMTMIDGEYSVTDAVGNVMFHIKGRVLSIRDRRVLHDINGYPIVSMQQKLISAHRRWQVFRGDSSDEKDLLFSVRKSSLLQFHTKLDVYLAANTKEKSADFKIEGSILERSCTIYAGGSHVIIAQMQKQHNIANFIMGNDMFGVTVYPNVDYAFIVALIVVLDGINEDRHG